MVLMIKLNGHMFHGLSLFPFYSATFVAVGGNVRGSRRPACCALNRFRQDRSLASTVWP
ncbi:protein of unknown function (plasmid) [Azospirillum baldaniorum]|uniref:Uncharacterized protein n=1 Tax=Azospirillum baldaniorum TaxID=1064539 RepID=A0A9P1NQ05_9PROT|nr:protein of unknown function [Azospirillum baldaniorum]